MKTTREADPAWVSASDLAEYAYCPRAHWYRHHPPAGSPTAETRERIDHGVTFHRSTLRREERDQRWGALYPAIAIGAIAVLVGGIVWLWLL